MEAAIFMERKFLKAFFFKSVFLLIILAAVVFMVDPFFHYHKNLGPLKAVVTDPEYQVDGTLRNFDYDSVILGSSVAENYDNHLFDQAFGCKTVKAIQKSASYKDLLYYLDIAYQSHELKNVFYSFDLFSLLDDTNHVLSDSMPLYLYNKNPFDDISYVWNKDVLFEKIPYMVMQSFGCYDEGLSYNWAKYKQFSEDIARSNYAQSDIICEDTLTTEDMDHINSSLDRILSAVSDHPDTNFYFIYPPYSVLWWDDIYRSGQLSLYYYATEQSFEKLLSCPNVKLFYFQNLEDIVTNLNNYMDPIHFSGAINNLITDRLAKDSNLVTPDNMDLFLTEMKTLVTRTLLP